MKAAQAREQIRVRTERFTRQVSPPCAHRRSTSFTPAWQRAADSQVGEQHRATFWWAKRDDTGRNDFYRQKLYKI
jgi:hypothetical protein